MKATTKDLRLKTRELIAATDRGEEVIITFRGRERARLVPLATTTAPDRKRNPAFAMWNDQEGSVSDQLDALRQARKFD
ncbi:MAG: type II toxin-antitoxin system prevent-host-death family antitoxin [Wenzhouxiangella sp.]|nr:MAG: type II toxin-antitoxin system prevent-host-death family antitoxin [Wenzhouxiangella sp.]